MAFAHVLNKTQHGTEFIRLDRIEGTHNLRAVVVPVPDGAKPIRVKLELEVDNLEYFSQLTKSIREAPKSFDLTINGETNEVTGSFIPKTRMLEFVNTNGTTILLSLDADDTETESYASVGAAAAVAVVAILVIGAMVIAHDKGSMEAEAESDGKSGSVSVQASGGGDDSGGNNDNGNGEGGSD